MKKYLSILLLLAPVLVFGQTQLKFNQINPTLPANFQVINNGKTYGADSLNLGSPIPYASNSADTIVFVGTSITAGSTGAVPVWTRYSSQVCYLTGFKENNQGRIGTTLGNPSSSGTSLINNLSVIPTKTSHKKWLIFEYPPNDIIHGFSYSSTTFQTDYTTVINYALSHGWDAAHIVLMTSFWMNNSSLKLTMTTSQFQARQDSFNSVIKTLAVSNATKIVDMYKISSGSGGGYLSSDGLHPNVKGYFLMAQSIVNTLFPQVVKKGQSLAANGNITAQSLNLNQNLSTSDNVRMLGLDTLNNVVVMPQLPADILTKGDAYINGKLIQTNSLKPDSSTFPNTAYNAYDQIWNNKARIIGGYSSGGDNRYWTMIEPADVSMNMNFRTGILTGDINFYLLGTKQVINLHQTDTSTNIYGNVILQSSKYIQTVAAGTKAGISFFHNGAITTLFNNNNTGRINIEMANGTNGGAIQMFNMTQLGRASFTQNGDGTDYVSARLAVNSTTEGFLAPRMTTVQRDAIAHIYSINMVGNGTGYTSATISLSGTTGSGFTATPVFASGQITSWTITNAGTGYLTPQTVTISGNGTGASATATILNQGLLIFNTTNSRYEYYSGTAWVGLQGDGSQIQSTVSKTANYTATISDYTIRVDASGGAVSITLPANTGQILNIKKIDSSGNAVTLVGTVDGVTNPTLTSQYQTKQIQYNGTSYDNL